VAIVAVVAIGGTIAPDGGTGPTRRMAIVQGGGVRGMRAVESDPRTVFDAHLAASTGVRGPVDLVLWPEDVIDVDGPIVAAPERDEVAAVARATGATLVGGVVEDAGPERFFNAVVAWSPSGDIVGRYDKVHRVPFGEYVPGRALIRRVADLTVIPRDAIPGRGTGLLRTPAGPFGVVISYEVFFADRARSAIRAGGELLLVPTNASSFRTSQVPTTEVATARLRAIETGRDVVQSAPTGYGAFIDNRGTLRVRTTLGRQQVIERTVHLRTGRTPYVRFGDLPALVLAALALAAAWLLERGVPRRRSRRPTPPWARPAGS
jgi:apolipoprotein N-acyltransferase